MGKEDINIIFAACLAIIMLIISAIAQRKEDRKLLKARVHDPTEEKQDQLAE
jgi:hypothetical protein